MEGPTDTSPTPEPHQPLVCLDAGQASPFSQQWVTITKQEHIELNWRANYWEAQHARVKSQLEEARQENIVKDAKIKDLQNRLFGKKTEKDKTAKSEKGNNPNPPSKRNRGQQPGSRGHGRTQRPDLSVVHDEIDLAEDEKRCPKCGLSHRREPALDEHSDVIEVQVSAHIRRYRRPAYTRNPGCTCEDTPAIREVFVEIEGKVGTRWYLWVTRSQSVIFYCLDPSRSAAVPGAHFAGLQQDRVIIVCGRYSA